MYKIYYSKKVFALLNDQPSCPRTVKGGKIVDIASSAILPVTIIKACLCNNG